ncbi:MAG: glycosyltransferase family 4 protein, partial [Verrucomicrobiota bacterium]
TIGYTQRYAATAQAGYAVTVWVPDYPNPPDMGAEPNWPFALRRIPMHGTRGWGDRVALAQEILSGTPPFRDCILHIAEPGPLATMLYLQWLPLVLSHRLILTLHGSDILLFSALPHRKLLMRRLLRRAECIHVLSRYNAELLKARFPEAAPKLRCIPGAPRELVKKHIVADSPAPEQPPETEPSERVILLTVGRIHPRKGQQMVIEALQQLPEALQAQIEYWVAGPVVNRAYMRRLQALGHESPFEVRFFGAVSQEMLDTLYAQADIFVMASQQQGNSIEGFGLSYIEASAVGLPVVGFRTGGVEDAIREGETGLLAEAGDIAGLSRALQELIEQPERRKQLGANGFRFASSLSWHDTACALYGDAPHS